MNSVSIDKNSEKLYASSRSFQPVGTKCADGRYISSEELCDFIADYFSKTLENYGFKYLKSKKAFKRTTKNGCDEIRFNFNDYVHYHLNFAFKKRINVLQKIITAVYFELGFNSNSNYKEQSTVGVSYRNLVKDGRIEVISYSVLEKELPKVLKLIENEIIPYFDKLEDINLVSQTLNYPEKDTKNPFSHYALLGGFDISIIEGLIIAKTLNDQNYNNLFNSYMEKNPQNIILKEKLVKLSEYFKQKEIEK
jgi:hypothetical protein